MAKWLDKYDNGGSLAGPKIAPIKLDGTEVFEHGEDTATANKEENGVNPTNLTEKGIKYAEKVGKHAASKSKKAVISSPIQRAQETADIIANTAGIPHNVNPILATWNIGEYDGAPEGSFKEKDWVKTPNAPVPGGEPFNSFAQRMEQAYDMVKAAPKSDEIITHSKVTRAFKALEDTGGQWTDKTTKKFIGLKDEPKKENGGWLNKYEQGGMVLEKKGDNYGKQGNYNDAQVSTGPGFVGTGYDTKGRNYSPAWGGQFQDGGSLHNKAWVDSVNNANMDKDFVQRYYAKNNPPAPIHLSQTPSGEMSTHYMADADNMVFPTVVNPKTFNPLDVYTQPGKLQYLDKPGPVVDRRTAVDYARRTGEYIDFKNEQDAQWYANNGYKKGTGVLNSIDKGKAYNNPNYAMGGSMPGAVGFTYARTAGSAPANGKYTKKTQASAQNGKEMEFYQNGLDFTPKSISKNGSVIKDDRGQWAHPGEITRINSNNITMEGVDYPVLGVSDTGHQQMMYPDQHYKFKGKKVTEYPMAQDGWLSKSIDAVGNVMSAPARGMTYLATGKYQDPSEALGITNPYAKFATDAVLDPINLIGGIGLINDARKLGKEAKLIEEASKVKKAAEPLATSRIRSMEEVREYNKNLVKPGADFKTGATKAPPKGMEPRLSKDENGGWLDKYSPEPMRQDATRVAAPLHPMSDQEKLAAEAVSDQAQKRALAHTQQVIAERQKGKTNKGDINKGGFTTQEKLRAFPNSVGGVGEMVDEYLNPGFITGELASNLGNAVASRDPKAIAAGLATPALAGAMGLNPIEDAATVMKGIPKATRAGLNTIDRNFSNVGKELAQIEKEGLEMGVSPEWIKRRQLQKVGITASQREAYVPGISDALEKYIYPQAYTGIGNSETKFSQTMNAIKTGKRTQATPPREDAWSLYLGKPQKSSTFRIAETAPINHPSYTPEQLSKMDIYSLNNSYLYKDDEYNTLEGIGPHVIDETTIGLPGSQAFLLEQNSKMLTDPISYSYNMPVMGGFNRRLNQYGLEYNDIWDLEPELFGKKIKVDKFIGKPFMSHGVLPNVTPENVKSLLTSQIKNADSELKPMAEFYKDLMNKGSMIDYSKTLAEHEDALNRINKLKVSLGMDQDIIKDSKGWSTKDWNNTINNTSIKKQKDGGWLNKYK